LDFGKCTLVFKWAMNHPDQITITLF
jgi:hypothetical protein